MNDSQWPRFQVFLQERAGAPHQDVGSVHAPDPEMALQNARDVFVRRPECVNLWVVPAQAIFSRTTQQLKEQGLTNETTPPNPREEPEEYYVFCKDKAAGTQVYVGSVDAASPQQAMRKALEEFSDNKPAFSWWVFPVSQVVRSEPEDIESMFMPALDKPFRLATNFHTLTAMRQIKKS